MTQDATSDTVLRQHHLPHLFTFDVWDAVVFGEFPIQEREIGINR